MSENQKTTSSGMVDASTLIFVVFLTLKLAGIGQVATWSWWWVTSPLWIPIVLVVAIVAIVGVVGIVYGIAKNVRIIKTKIK